MLKLSRAIITQINGHGIESYPLEGCGLLLGRMSDGTNVVTEIMTVPNTWPVEEEKRERFRIDQEEMFRAELAAAEKDLDIVGIFHSHPEHPPVASPRDLAWAAWSGYSYLITEVRGRKAQKSRSWQLLADRSGFIEEEIEIVD